MCLVSLVSCGAPNNRPAAGDNSNNQSQGVPAAESRSAAKLGLIRLPDHDESIQDPNDDGWNTEAVASAASAKLKKIAKAIALRQLDLSSHIVANTARFGPLRPINVVPVFSDENIRVFRPAEPTSLAPEHAPTTEFGDQLEVLLQPHGEATVDAHFKIVSVQLTDEQATTRVLFDSKSTSAGAVQQKASWDCTWRIDRSDPVLTEVQVSNYELVTSQTPSEHGVWFSDMTEDVFAGSKVYRDHLSYGLNHWLQQFERAQLMDDSVRTGLAIGDVNGDGRDDVYCCQGPGLPNRLLLQRTDGTVEDVSHKSGTDWLDQTSAALILDFNNDGDQDLAVATRGGVLIMKNDGNANFQLMAQVGPEGIDSQSMTASDYDQDGDLDIFVCAYRPPSGRRSGDFVFHDADTGGANYLLRNDIDGGSWNWTDVTTEAGLSSGATRYSLAAGWEDYDNDGDQDLYVANDYGRNYLYRNETGRFIDATESVGLKDTGFGMSVGWGDFNNDGVADLYVGNMFSSAGSRITSDPKFQPNSTAEQKAIYRRMAKGNSLFQGNGTTFQEVTETAGVAMGRWAWSSVFSDLNSDGLQDIVIANGYITTEDTGDL